LGRKNIAHTNCDDAQQNTPKYTEYMENKQNTKMIIKKKQTGRRHKQEEGRIGGSKQGKIGFQFLNEHSKRISVVSRCLKISIETKKMSDSTRERM
jgi:hypothetical protein